MMISKGKKKRNHHQGFLRDSQSRKFHINLVWPLNQIYLNAICRYRLLSFSLSLSNDVFAAQLWAPWPIKWIRLPVAFFLLAFALSPNILPFYTMYVIYMYYYIWHVHIYTPEILISPMTPALMVFKRTVFKSHQSHQSFPVAAAAAGILWDMTCHKPSSGLLVELHSANWRSCSLLSYWLVHHGSFIFRSSLCPHPVSVLCMVITTPAHRICSWKKKK